MIDYQDFDDMNALRKFVDLRARTSIISIETLEIAETFRVWYWMT